MTSDSQSVIDHFIGAAEANRRTPQRRGCVIHLERPAQDVVIAADLHGHRLNLQRIIELADLDAHPQRHLVLQEACHGGPCYPNSHACMSHLLLEDIAQLKKRWPERLHFILSNHELAELIDLAIAKGSRMLNVQFRSGLEHQYGDAADMVHEAAMEFIRTCPLALRTWNRVWISHSVPANVAEDGYDASIFARDLRPSDLARNGDAFRLVWGRDFRHENAIAFGNLVDATVMIHGHEPCKTGYMTPNPMQIILDSSKSPACCLLLPLDAEPTMASLVEGVRFL